MHISVLWLGQRAVCMHAAVMFQHTCCHWLLQNYASAELTAFVFFLDETLVQLQVPSCKGRLKNRKNKVCRFEQDWKFMLCQWEFIDTVPIRVSADTTSTELKPDQQIKSLEFSLLIKILLHCLLLFFAANKFFSCFFGEDSRTFDFKWLRYPRISTFSGRYTCTQWHYSADDHNCKTVLQRSVPRRLHWSSCGQRVHGSRHHGAIHDVDPAGWRARRDGHTRDVRRFAQVARVHCMLLDYGCYFFHRRVLWGEPVFVCAWTCTGNANAWRSFFGSG